MEGNPGSAPVRRGRACVPWKPSDVWTVLARCCTRCLHAQQLSGRFVDANIPGPDAPLWTIGNRIPSITEIRTWLGPDASGFLPAPATRPDTEG
jgi:hypothetical protein